MPEMTLYDIARKGGNNCWSPNVWKTRLVLNYKNLNYRTEWLTHPEIAPKLKDLGLAPHPPGPSSPYTLPTLVPPKGSPIMDSLAIATALETQHPSPPLHLDNNLHNAVGPILGKISLPLIPVFMPLIGRTIVPDSASTYFHETRAQRFGMPLAQLEAEKGGEQAWQAARPGIEELKAFLRESKKDEGPFVLGSEVCYADFVVAAMMESLRRIGPELYGRFVREDGEGALRGLHEACSKWMEKDT